MMDKRKRGFWGTLGCLVGKPKPVPCIPGLMWERGRDVFKHNKKGTV